MFPQESLGIGKKAKNGATKPIGKSSNSLYAYRTLLTGNLIYILPFYRSEIK